MDCFFFGRILRMKETIARKLNITNTIKTKPSLKHFSGHKTEEQLVYSLVHSEIPSVVGRIDILSSLGPSLVHRRIIDN